MTQKHKYIGYIYLLFVDCKMMIVSHLLVNLFLKFKLCKLDKKINKNKKLYTMMKQLIRMNNEYMKCLNY